ncbi:MAG: alpha/beta fold hydrolase [Myxococcota bacterium]|nr:alpha/beta fold hydrolase [Myxococcota bacterium]
MTQLDVGGHALRVEVSGSGPPDLICLHGLVDRLEIWDPVAAPLAQRARVIRLDQRGHGESEAPPGPYVRADLAGDVVTVIDRLAGGRAVLVGHSMGGIVSMATALAQPDRVAGLVLIGTASRCNEKTAGWYERIARAGERDGIDGLGRAIYGPKPRTIVGDAQGIAHVTRMLKSLYDDPLTERLGEIRCPVLLLVGENDPMGARASAIIADALPDAQLEQIPDCGHWVHVERPDALIAAYDRWASRCTGRGPDLAAPERR